MDKIKPITQVFNKEVKMVPDDEESEKDGSQTENYMEKAWLFETLKTVKAG